MSDHCAGRRPRTARMREIVLSYPVIGRHQPDRALLHTPAQAPGTPRYRRTPACGWLPVGRRAGRRCPGAGGASAGWSRLRLESPGRGPHRPTADRPRSSSAKSGPGRATSSAWHCCRTTFSCRQECTAQSSRGPELTRHPGHRPANGEVRGWARPGSTPGHTRCQAPGASSRRPPSQPIRR